MSQPRMLHLAAQAIDLTSALSTKTDPVQRKYDLGAMVQAARILEDAKFDAVFEADSVLFDIDDAGSVHTSLQVDTAAAAAALAAVTSRIGLVITATTTFNLPYALARQFQTIDQLSGGRFGWNAVTSVGGERQYGLDEMPDQTDRYRRGAEFVDIVLGLWGSWHADVTAAEGARGRPRIDPTKVDRFTYEGEFLRTDGALGVPRSPQGWPVVWQAGASVEGLRFAGRYAEAIFSASPDLDHALGYRARLAAAVDAASAAGQRRAGEAGPLVFPGVHLITGATEPEAREQERALVEALDLEAGRRSLALTFGAVVAKERDGATGIDLSDLDLDEPIPAERLDALPDSESLRRRRSRTELYRGLARKGLTLRELIVEHLQSHAHYRFTGSYDQVADELALWFDRGAAEGFVLRFSNGARTLTDVVEHVVPRLQDRGLFRREYEGSTLREHLGLAVPA